MNYIQYKNEFARSNVILDRWLFILGITIHQHKAYSSGRTSVPSSIQLSIEKLNNRRHNALKKLKEALLKIKHIEHYNMHIDEKDNLVLTPLSEEGAPLIFENQGLDFFLFHVYGLSLDDVNLTLIFYPKNGLRTDGKPESPCEWFIIKAGEQRISHIIHDPANELHNMLKISLNN
ncbi:hypothetical protein BKK54_11095 [Rodentibacter genomosp. 1]|uniref:Uncharacterized protein n=1 Tax=Rodentibacter genomosp. 1 TaxID=1908264 RepID=A0A1V3J0Q8_9PAST|nr:hypothetical protein [Rodentibacter genomosp. 1]OOF48299.1 hypothetical protein BKK54_11095 [Rodentibacter genomosp. 1]